MKLFSIKYQMKKVAEILHKSTSDKENNEKDINR